MVHNPPWCIAMFLAALGCGGPQSSEPVEPIETEPDEPEGPSDALTRLPALPFELDAASDEMRGFWLGLGNALDLKLAPPRGTGDAALGDWVQETLPQWMLERSSINSALGELALRLQGIERDVARAGLAYLIIDTARMLQGSTFPDEVRNHAQVQSTILEPLVNDSMPLIDRGRDLMARCAETEGLEDWQAFCRRELATLPPSTEEPATDEAEEPEPEAEEPEEPEPEGEEPEEPEERSAQE